MKSAALSFAVLFLIVSTVSAFLGFNILAMKRRAAIHRSFFAVCMCLGVWALGFSIASGAPTEQACLFWRRVAAVGWGSIFAIVLHFTLILTGNKNILCRKWLLALLYLPAAAVVAVFSLSAPMAHIQYRLARMQSGWVNVAVNNGWDIFFYAYLCAYSLMTLALLYRWGKKSPDANVKRQARLMMLSFGGAVLLGAATDLVNNSVLLLGAPQMAPVLFVLPLVAIDHCIRKYRMMKTGPGDESQAILTDTGRNKILNYIAAGFAFAGALYLATQYMMGRNDLLQAWVASGVLLSVGLGLFLLNRKISKKETIDNTFIMTAIIIIPVLTLNFIEYAGVTVWAFPLIFVILSTLFNNRNLLIASALSVFSTQLLVWSLSPGTVSVNIDNVDYLARFSILSLAVWVAFYVNKVYVLRLKENADKNKYQKLISDVSARFVAISGENREAGMRQALLEAGECMRADSAALALFEANGRAAASYAWEAGNAAVSAQMKSAEQAEEANNEKSTLSAPVGAADFSEGYFRLESGDPKRKWSADEAETLKIIANIVSDALAKLSAEDKTEFMAYHDHLTKLPNRLLFSQRAAQALRLAERAKKLIGIVFLDLDSFKSVNDAMGHKMGDELIAEVSDRLTSHMRASDAVCRFGGDEFLIMLNNGYCRSDLARITDSVMGLFGKPFSLRGQEVFLTASAGISVFPADGTDVDTLIKKADIAMYNAKEKGKNQYLFCSEDMMQEVEYRSKLTNHLYHALARNELQVCYQPQVCLRTNSIIGAEALLRWSPPEFGAVPPGVFIPLAEKTGVIHTIGEWVLREACRQNREWQDKGLPAIRMAVNISAIQFRNPSFIDQVTGILSDTRLDQRYLELEVTEGAAIREPAHIISLLNGLKRLGILHRHR